jgi:hypothetical protein
MNGLKVGEVAKQTDVNLQTEGFRHGYQEKGRGVQRRMPGV